MQRQEAALTETSKAAKAEAAVLQTELQAAESRARKLDSQLSDAKALAAEQGEVSRTRAAQLTERVRELEAVLEQERGRAAYQVSHRGLLWIRLPAASLAKSPTD